FDDNRERESEGRTLARVRLDPDLAPVQLDDALRYGEPQAGAALLASDGIVSLLELLKEFGLIGCGDARASIADGYTKRAIIRFGLDGDFTGIGELDGVTDQIDQNLCQSATVATTRRQFAGDVDLERELFVGCQRLKRAADRLGNVLNGV